tara:strand:+ start:113 stop:700 length:588 start_codon:yes stop_codon:yes gene_type:complete
MTDKIILADCDGVLLDWEKHFNKWMVSLGYEIKHPELSEMYRMEEKYDTTPEEGRRLIRTFNESSNIGFIEPFRDARSGVAKLSEAGYTFHIITSMSDHPYSKQLRRQNLDRVFGKGHFSELICLPTAGDKHIALKKYENTGYYWLEDKAENAEAGLLFGLKSILIEHGHNKNYKNDQILRAVDWVEIVEIILNK